MVFVVRARHLVAVLDTVFELVSRVRVAELAENYLGYFFVVVGRLMGRVTPSGALAASTLHAPYALAAIAAYAARCECVHVG